MSLQQLWFTRSTSNLLIPLNATYSDYLWVGKYSSQIRQMATYFEDTYSVSVEQIELTIEYVTILFFGGNSFGNE